MTNPNRLAVLRIVMLISLAFRSASSEALGLGPMRLQSALGQSLRASVQVLGPEAKSLSETCIRSRLLAPDGGEILRPDIELKRRNGATEITLASRAVVEEPAVTLAIEITCAPELHREYQLLLDLRDGLPRVVAQDADAAAVEKAQAAARMAVAGGAGRDNGNAATERRGKRRARSATQASEPGRGADAMEVSADSDDLPLRPRARGLPGARTVLKLSQDDLGTVRKPIGLKLSETLSSLAADQAAPASEEILAAKARFLAMMRNEDPVAAAQQQIRSLQAQLQRPVAAAASAARKPAPVADGADEAAAAASASAERVRGFSFWLIGLGALLLALVAVVAAMVRGRSPSGKKNAKAWWLAANDNGAEREAELLQSALAMAASRKQPAPPEGHGELDRMLSEDTVVHRYVSQFISTKPVTDAQTGRRIEPFGLTAPGAEAASPEPTLAPMDEKGAGQNAAAHTMPHSAQNGSRHDSHDDRPPSVRGAGESFELVSDVMQEAEFWKMLNETKRAIDILEAYCTGESVQSPVPWLYLADLYLGSGDMASHARLQQRFRMHFNGRMSDDSSSGESADTRRSLEEYPHLMDKISKLWGQQDIVPFLQDLLINQRDAPRDGFTLPVYREILLLIEVAREREQEFA